ncbi:MAG: hypothetical protein EOO75_05345 [Myxococcales bacterium]|nr:MAG: hypothetical protein EOO75_05345 [Myxococcales bacterium]
MSDGRVAVAYIEQGGQVPRLMLRAVSPTIARTVPVQADFPTDVAVASPAAGTIVVAWLDGTASLLVARYQCAITE